MLYRLMADGVVIAHALFIVFSVLGGLLALRWPRVVFLHLPAAAWGVIVQVIQGGVCPLTPLENHLRDLGNEPGIGPSFIDHYITSLIYVSDPPAWLHTALGIGVLVINLTVYTVVIVRWRRRVNARRQAAAESGGAGQEDMVTGPSHSTLADPPGSDSAPHSAPDGAAARPVL